MLRAVVEREKREFARRKGDLWDRGVPNEQLERNFGVNKDDYGGVRRKFLS